MTKTFKTTPYRRGREFEYRVRDILVARGYRARRSRGSRGPYDIRAWKLDSPTLFVEVKSLKKYMSKKHWLRLNEAAHEAGAIPLLAHRTREGRCRPVIFETEDGERYEP